MPITNTAKKKRTTAARKAGRASAAARSHGSVKRKTPARRNTRNKARNA